MSSRWCSLRNYGSERQLSVVTNFPSVVVFLEDFSVRAPVTFYLRSTIMKMNAVLNESVVMFAGYIQFDCDLH